MSYLRKRRIEKIVVSGISQVGTTTVAYSLRKGIAPPKSLVRFSTIDYVSTSMTIGKTRIDIFDLGGQKSFQDRFTGELSEYIFSDVSSFIFVVDSVEIKMLSRAKYYFDLS
jgi:GTPase SAR1 family protein